MNTEERVRQAIDMLKKSVTTPEFDLHLQRLKQEDTLAFSLVEVRIRAMRHQYPLVIRKGTRLIPRVSDKPYLAWELFGTISVAYREMGEMENAETYIQRALEMAELMGDGKAIFRTRLQMCAIRVFRAEYERGYKELLDCRKDTEVWEPHHADYFLGTYTLVRGQPEEAVKTFGSFFEAEENEPLRLGALEMKALALRISGRLSEAMKTFVESARGHIGFDSS